MNERNIVRTFSRAPITSVSWTTVTLGKDPDGSGFDTETESAPVVLNGWVTTPRPNEFVQNEQGQPVIIDNIIYFLGFVNIQENDYLEYIPKDSLTAIKSQVKKFNYKKKWDYSAASVQYLKERVRV